MNTNFLDAVAGRVTADVSLDGRPAKQLDFDAPRADPGASVSVARALPGFLLEGKTALVLGDHAEASRALSASFAGLGARVAAGDLNAAATGTWVHALATAASGTVTHVDLPSPSRGQPNAHHSQTAPRPVGAPSASLAKDGTGVDVAVLVVSSPGMNRRSQADGDGDLALVSSQLGAARSVVAGVAPGMRLRRWGRVVVVTVTGPQGDEAGEVLAGACNALVRSWGTEFGGCGLTCNSVNVTAGPAGGDGGGGKGWRGLGVSRWAHGDVGHVSGRRGERRRTAREHHPAGVSERRRRRRGG